LTQGVRDQKSESAWLPIRKKSEGEKQQEVREMERVIDRGARER